MPMSSLLIILMLTAVIGLAAVCAALVLALRLKRLQKQLRNDNPPPAEEGASHDKAADFQTPLRQATLLQRLQQNQPQRPAPDKYRLAAEMASQGMTAQQIADLLMLPPAEVRQLVSLSRAGRSKTLPAGKLDAAAT